LKHSILEEISEKKIVSKSYLEEKLEIPSDENLQAGAGRKRYIFLSALENIGKKVAKETDHETNETYYYLRKEEAKLSREGILKNSQKPPPDLFELLDEKDKPVAQRLIDNDELEELFEKQLKSERKESKRRRL